MLITLLLAHQRQFLRPPPNPRFFQVGTSAAARTQARFSQIVSQVPERVLS
jgi:hypothetical protein